MKHKILLQSAAVGALLLASQVPTAQATVIEQPSLSLSWSQPPAAGSSFSVAVDLHLPQGSVANVTEIDISIFYFDDNLPRNVLDGSTPSMPKTPLVLTDITAGSLVNSATSYFLLDDPRQDPRQQQGGSPQASAIFIGDDVNQMLSAPADGRLVNLQFSAASFAKGSQSLSVQATITALTDPSNFNDGFQVIPVSSATTLVVGPPTISVPEASTAVLIAGGLLLMVFGRQKLRFSPH